MIAEEVENSAGASSVLTTFYSLLSSSSSTHLQCKEPSFMMPNCTLCIPGLTGPACDLLHESTESIRSEIEKLTRKRYGPPPNRLRRYALYPYLENEEFLERQKLMASSLVTYNAKNILDIGTNTASFSSFFLFSFFLSFFFLSFFLSFFLFIFIYLFLSFFLPISGLKIIYSTYLGAYYNPVHLFIEDPSFCPESVVVVEPILDPLSVIVPCKGSSKTTHVLILPLTFKEYIRLKHLLPIPSPDSIVCIGCDSIYGPNRAQLEGIWTRPFKIYLEYPIKYAPNAPFNKMRGDGPGESMLLSVKKKYVSAKDYNIRGMKIIEYLPVNGSSTTTGNTNK